MHTSLKIERSQCFAISEEGSRGGRCASFDFAQDEVEFDVPSTPYLILSEVEGRRAPMQCCDVCIDQPGGRGFRLAGRIAGPRAGSRRSDISSAGANLQL